MIPTGKAILTKAFLTNMYKNLRQQEIFYHICDHKIDNSIGELFEQISKLQKGYQLIYTPWHLQGEVNNGGYYQYFDNFENCNDVRQPYYDLTVDYLKMIGRTKLSEDYLTHLQLYKECEKLKNSDECDSKCAECNKCEAFDKSIEDLDNAFYASEHEFIQAIDDYIEANLDDFVSFDSTE